MSNLPDPLRDTLRDIRNIEAAQRAVWDNLAKNIRRPWDDQEASDFHVRLVRMIADFEDELDPAQEVGVRLVSFGQTVVFHLESIGYYNPALIRFFGRTSEGEPVELIQHVSQISVLLMRVPALDPDNPRRIGFHHDHEG